jgi:hypothetical protein
VAAGVFMGEPATGESPLKIIVLIGDGGAGIGMLHFIHAAQLNVDVTVLVHNNLVFGMTGGQHSLLTPPGLKTTTTPEGSPVPSLDLGALLPGAGAGYFARVVVPGENVARTIGEAILYPGFACVEALELCPAYATRVGGVTGKTLQELPDPATSDRVHRVERMPFPRPTPGAARERETAPPGIAPDRSLARLHRTAQLVLGGRAGARVQSAALLAATAATAAGLHTTVRTDNPVTQGRGFSLAELTVSPEPIDYTGLVHPDLVIAVAPEGYRELAARGLLEAPGCARRYVLDEELEPPVGLAVATHPFKAACGERGAALGALFREISRAGWWESGAWEIAIARLSPERRKDAMAILRRTEGTCDR